MIKKTGSTNDSDAVSAQTEYQYEPNVEKLQFTDAVDDLVDRFGQRIIVDGVNNIAPDVIQDIFRQANEAGIELVEFNINLDDFEEFYRQVNYSYHYPGYHRQNIKEKALEHYLCMKLLDISPSDVFIDIGSEHSPFPDIIRRLAGSKTYSQDIMYPPGLHDDRIGGDACSMPVPDHFATKASLSCSLEHFEGDGDTRLFLELARVLDNGGKVAVVPLYLHSHSAVQTDPSISLPVGVHFDDSCLIYCAKDWNNRFGRFYSIDTLNERLLTPLNQLFNITIYSLINAHNIDDSIYARFALLAEKKN